MYSTVTQVCQLEKVAINDVLQFFGKYANILRRDLSLNIAKFAPLAFGDLC